MRITGGSLRGKQVKVPGGQIRPAMDKMRESVFAALGNLDGVSFLDVFSGSGVIALEAASRGAVYIEAVEADPQKRRILLENVKLSPVRINCRFMPAELYIKRAKRCFDIIFCDPPFPYKHRRELIESITLSPLMTAGSRLLLHCPKEEQIADLPLKLKIEDKREYGRSLVFFYVFSIQ